MCPYQIPVALSIFSLFHIISQASKRNKLTRRPYTPTLPPTLTRKGATRFVLCEAQKRFRRIFGFDLVRGTKLNLSANSIRQAKSKEKTEDSYWIVNSLAQDYAMARTLLGRCGSTEDNTARGILLAIFGFLFCANENRAAENKLLHYLRQLNQIHRGEDDGTAAPGGGGRGRKRGRASVAPIGDQGGITEYLQLFVSQGFLHKHRDPNATTDDGKAVFVYSAGQRFFTEIGWHSVIEFLGQARS